MLDIFFGICTTPPSKIKWSTPYYIMYLFEKDEDFTVQQALLASINLYSNGTTSLYSNIMELSKSYNLPDFVPSNLEKTKISRFIT